MPHHHTRTEVTRTKGPFTRTKGPKIFLFPWQPCQMTQCHLLIPMIPNVGGSWHGGSWLGLGLGLWLGFRVQLNPVPSCPPILNAVLYFHSFKLLE